jgi:predicted branched-subunit amino acid permease
MNRLPSSLAIALWFTGAIWLVAILVYVFVVDRHVLYATSLFGLVAAVLEWRASRRS